MNPGRFLAASCQQNTFHSRDSLASRHGGGLGECLLLAGQFGERLLEILGFAELAVDGGEAHLGDVVDIA